MQDSIISVEHLSKRYTLGSGGRPNERYTALRDVISRSVMAPFQSLRNRFKNNVSSTISDPTENEFWALRNVSFEIQQGEVVGIIGRNGAGKSTLLKVLSRITDPTEGRIKIKGRIASLLEVGTGFHPELTGRENIYLNGAILGMHRAEIKSKFDEIVAFAEVDKFLDTPVKRYSSGMYVRLAFAVAAHLDPEILIVDEVLAVGDSEFQKKCLGKMHDVASGGRTVLFVSHQMSAIEKLCTRTLVFREGKVALDDDSKTAIRFYLKELEGASVDFEKLPRTGSGLIRLTGFTLLDSHGICTMAVSSGDEVHLILHFECFSSSALRNVSVGISIHDHRGETLCISYNEYSGSTFDAVSGRGKFIYTIKDFPFSVGRYHVGARVLVSGVEADWPQQMIGTIDVEAGDFYGTGSTNKHSIGPILLRGNWSCEDNSALHS